MTAGTPAAGADHAHEAHRTVADLALYRAVGLATLIGS